MTERGSRGRDNLDQGLAENEHTQQIWVEPQWDTFEKSTQSWRHPWTLGAGRKDRTTPPLPCLTA